MCLIHMCLASNFLLRCVLFGSWWIIWGKSKLYLCSHSKYYLVFLQHFVHFRTFSLPLYHFSCLEYQTYRGLSHFLPVLNIMRLPWSVLWTWTARDLCSLFYTAWWKVNKLYIGLGTPLIFWWTLRPFPWKNVPILTLSHRIYIRCGGGRRYFRSPFIVSMEPKPNPGIQINWKGSTQPHSCKFSFNFSTLLIF